MSVGDVREEEAEVPSAFAFGGPCAASGPCPRVRASRPLSAATAAALGDRTADHVLAAALLLARKYSDSTAFRIGVRRAADAADVPLTVAMPSGTTAAEHLSTVTAGLAGLPAAADTAAGAPPKVVCAVDGPATEAAGADVVLACEVAADGVVLHADCHAHVHDAAFTDRMLGHLAQLLRQLTERPDALIGTLRLPTGPEDGQLRGFNDTARPYPRDSSLYALFAAQAAARPEQPAVSHQDGSLTYRELERQALRLAALLHTHGVGRHTRVAFALERTPRLLVAVLAVLRLGAAYVPLDTQLPTARRDVLLADSGAGLLLVDDPAVTADIPVLDLTRPHDADPGGLPDLACAPEDAAYVMYTSGTTGRPKGVLVNQRAVVRLVRGTDYADLSAATRILQTGALAFDATTLEYWGALLNGGTLVLVPPATVLNSVDLRAAIEQHRVNTLWLTATLFNQLVEQDPAVLAGCQVLVGGEAVSARHLTEAMDACPDSVFINAYGPTENTTFSVTHRLTRRYTGRVPIGRPIANSTAWVLDRDGNPQPLGVPGELHVGGDGLSDGYLHRPDLDAVSFVRARPGGREERLYRTGDLACWNADGLLDYLGRTDDQVKVRGYRVEPAEVESHIRRLPSVRACVVLLRRGGDGSGVLTAYFTAEKPLDPAQLRTDLLAQLPDHMVPSAFRQLDELPLNRNHKADRAALAALEPVDAAGAAGTGRAPATPLESTVAGLFAEALGVPSVALDDSFFDLGGHSLRMMRLWNRIRSVTGRAVELRQILDAPTVAGVVAALERSPAATTARPKLMRRS
ncbi:amino acid adenylation domain-containing protein [Streptomyces angustmyceticus]|uniref:amino acid adenylation domain-containing protein n=1 Tax=Streptomyces angustmyceticus TaxID=285578 RepID=UPI003D936761